MDLRYSESDEKFRAELRAWLAEHVPKHGPPPPTARLAGAPRLGHRAGSAGSSRPATPGINWPREYGGRDASPSEQLVYYEETARAGAPYIGVNFVGMLHGGPTLVAEGTPEQKARAPAAHPARRGDLVPGLLRAGRRVRSGRAQDARGARRRRLRRERAQDLVLVRARRGRRRAARAHRSERAQAQGHLLADPADGRPRHRDPPAADARRRGRVQRGLPERRAHSRSRTGWAPRTTAGASRT